MNGLWAADGSDHDEVVQSRTTALPFLSRRSLAHKRLHSFFRFFAFEGILLLMLWMCLSGSMNRRPDGCEFFGALSCNSNAFFLGCNPDARAL